jgi:hypothetical protein
LAKIVRSIFALRIQLKVIQLKRLAIGTYKVGRPNPCHRKKWWI